MPGTANRPHISTIKVPATGNWDADIAVVGEGPGKNEVYHKDSNGNPDPTPFVGKSGRKMDELFSMCGVSRSELFITNATKYFPWGKKEKLFFHDGDGHSKPTDFFLSGIAEMVEELQEVNPNVVVAFGNYAMWALTENWGIYSYHGSILESTVIPGQKVIPTLHPATVAGYGNYAAEPMIKWDLDKVVEESHTPEISLPEREFIILPSMRDLESKAEIVEAREKAEKYVDRILEAGHFTCDTEWYDPNHPSCIGFTCDPSWALVVPTDFPGVFDICEKLLDSDCRKIFQNAMFDVVYLRKAGVSVRTRHSNVDPDPMLPPEELLPASSEERLIEDTMVEHHVCWPDIRNRLENLTAIYTREPYYKADFQVWGETGNRKVLYEYNGRDVDVTEEVHIALQDEKEKWGTETAYRLNMLTFDVMAKAQVKGINADVELLRTMREENERDAERLENVLHSTVGWEVNPRSWKQVEELVYEQLGFRYRKRDSTAQETLMDIAAQQADSAEKTILCTLIMIRRLRNQNSRYTHERLVDVDGRIRCSWNLAGTKNGRLSASKDKFANRGASLQTIPYKARRIFIPDPGHVFIVPDLEQAEARFVAYDSGDFRVIDWIENGLDIHKKLAELIFEVPYDEIKKGTRERYLAKTCRHALNYGMGRNTFKLTINKEFIDTGIGVTQKEAEALRNKYLSIHAPLKSWWRWVKGELNDNSALENPLGRRRTFIQNWGHQLFQDAYAFRPQSTIADLTHIGLWRVDKALPYADVLVNLHDGSLIQVPEEHVDEACEVIQECLSIPINVKGNELTIPVETKVGYNWDSYDPDENPNGLRDWVA